MIILLKRGFFMRLTKQVVSFVLISMLYSGLILRSRPNQVYALETYQTNFNTGTWTNFSNGATTTTTGSPHTVVTNGHSFLFTYGSRDGSNNVYAGSLNNNNANSYFRLNADHINSQAEVILAPFDPLGSNAHEMVIAMKTSFYFISLSQITFEWESSAAQTFVGKAIYSLDEGLTWQSFADTFTVTSATSPKSVSQSVDSSYTSIRLGYYFGVMTLGSVFNIKNPVITMSYAELTDENAAIALKNEVILYTPCATDEDGLTLLTLAKKNELITKYDALSSNAKTSFATLSIGGGFTALSRYLFLTR
jgi:hypothetical protein